MTVGNFIVEIPRFRKLTAKPRFIAKYFSPQEMKFLMEKHFPVYTIAEMFAAKFAFVKAIGINAQGCSLNEISVLTDYSGTYYISLAGKTKKLFASSRRRICIDCTHTKNMALATIVLYE